jgi:opacity protein-like surface antigen
VQIEAGISPEMYLSHKEENEDGDFREEDYPKFHRFGLGSNAGIMYKIGKNIFIGARYTYSTIPIREHAGGYTYLLNRGQYSNSLSFSVFYHIP